ncbi:uncharacterized protein LOC110905425 isoform X2 [Helianthus annuus]|uniref:uncharacterized protein LOC110905423 isoform X2 n=1 Tax=Helianthus annuus TaxID=4232 RepID=UPI001652D515|nr:uncharacterized protein LOC110905423 isoform X2 [Helianthus annuus]XP_035839108.1 uncharacterized protein LOC110905425 isoform X2 [Helianthus annuus]
MSAATYSILPLSILCLPPLNPHTRYADIFYMHYPLSRSYALTKPKPNLTHLSNYTHTTTSQLDTSHSLFLVNKFAGIHTSFNIESPPKISTTRRSSFDLSENNEPCRRCLNTARGAYTCGSWSGFTGELEDGTGARRRNRNENHPRLRIWMMKGI